MYNFCTLFETNYLSRGLALYESLEKQCESFHLYIFAFNDKSFEVLNKLALKHATIISLLEFESQDLLAIKEDRSVGEYCWTCTSSTIKYCIEKFNLDCCTYLDADLYFFSSPKVLFDEIGNKSTLITEHRYTPEYDQTDLSGKYCVQFMIFKNNEEGLRVLNWWIDACLDWCYARAEDGKFGDQKYLDDWYTKFQGVHELQHLGGGVAPWNVQQYIFSKINGKEIGIEKKSNQKFDVVFYHFHNLKFIEKDKIELGEYTLTQEDIDILYKPYIQHIYQIKDRISKIDSSFDSNGTRATQKTLRSRAKLVKRKIEGNYNIYKKDYFLK